MMPRQYDFSLDEKLHAYIHQIRSCRIKVSFLHKKRTEVKSPGLKRDFMYQVHNHQANNIMGWG